MSAAAPTVPASGRRRSSLGRRLVFSFVTLALLGLAGSGWVLYRQALASLEQQLATHLMAEAQLVAAVLERSQVANLRPRIEGRGLHQYLLEKMEETRQALGARRMYVFDRHGRSLLDTQQGARIGRDIHMLRFHRPQVQAIWQGQLSHTERFTDERTGEHYMTAYAPIFDFGHQRIVAGLGIDMGASYMDAILGFKRSVVLLAGLGTLLTLVVGVGVARHITRPVQRLVTAAREIGRGNLEREVRVQATDEIGYLGETMEEMRRKLLARDAQLRQMLAGVAHEIRNPLSGIEIYAGLIAGELPEEDPRKEHIQKVIAEVRNLNLVISEFLDFARPASPQFEAVELAMVVDDAAFLLSPEMAAAGVQFVSQVPAGTRAHADAEQLKRAVINLMKNGVQAMAAAGGTLTVRAEHQGNTGERVALEIADTGPGVPEQVRQRLFEPFFTTRQKGSGLGLAIVQKTAETHAGHVEVESTEGEGTTFRLMLPAVPSATAAALAEMPS